MTKIEWPDVLGLMDKRYTLHYVDYRDSLDSHLDVVQKAIRGNPDALYEAVDEWFLDDYYAQDEVKQELKKALMEQFDLEEPAADAVMEEYQEQIQETMWDRDDSNVLRDLLRNTRDPVVFYETEIDIGDYTSDLDERVKDVKRAFKIRLKDATWDKEIEEMCANASYGGQLVVYFTPDVEDLIATEGRTVRFTSPSVAVINVYNGSGWHCHLNGAVIKFPFDKERLYLDKLIKYSYTYQVCGMADDWCSDTGWEVFGKAPAPMAGTEKPVSAMAEHVQREAVYNKAFKEGRCTHGDMDIKRHRKTKYINEIPCGIHCMECGTFWID